MIKYNNARLTKQSISRSPLRLVFFLTPLALACFTLSPAARALTPPPLGGYPSRNTATGTDALFNLIPGAFDGLNNTAVGFDALFNTVTGSQNTALGEQALFSNLSDDNTAIGTAALFYNTTGNANTAVGALALIFNTTGLINTATGADALYLNTTGSYNTAAGGFALLNNTTGNNNTAMGFDALDINKIGSNNTAFGYAALAGDPNFGNATGNNNTGIGFQALVSYTTGSNNVANGSEALFNDTTGNYNTANGQTALFANTTGSNNTADGQNALRSNTTGSNNIALGSNAGLLLTTGSNNIDIFHRGAPGEANTIRIGKQGTQSATFIAGIRGGTTQIVNAIPVLIDSAGQLGTISSSRRFKKEIEPMDQTSEAILGLKPVTFHYKSDSKNAPQFGLIAEEVAEVNPDLVVRDEDGEIYTVRYDAVSAMLLNEFLKEHRKVQEQEVTIAQLKKDFGTSIAQLTARLDEQASQIKKVSAQVETSKPAPQVVNNP